MTDDEQIDQMMYEAEVEQRKQEDRMTRVHSLRRNWYRLEIGGTVYEIERNKDDCFGDFSLGHGSNQGCWEVFRIVDGHRNCVGQARTLKDAKRLTANEVTA